MCAAKLKGEIPSMRTLGPPDALSPLLWSVYGQGKRLPCPLHDQTGHREWAKAYNVHAAVLSVLGDKSLPCECRDPSASFPVPSSGLTPGQLPKIGNLVA